MDLYKTRIFWLIAFFAALRAVSAPFFGYGVDEAHYILYAKNLALSYFDHPPLVGWVHYLFSFFGEGEFWARVPAILLSIIDSVLVFSLLRSKGEEAALWGVAALNASLTLGVLFLTLMPDSLLITFMLLSIFAIKRALKYPNLSSYLLLGLSFGFLGLGKYTAILFVPAAIIYVLAIKRADMLITPKILLAVIAALVCVSPVAIWNFQNDFVSLSYQASHVSGGDGGSFKNFFVSLARQFASYNPLLFMAAFYGVYRSIKEREFRLELFFGLSVLLFMFASQYRQVALPHWISPFFALFIPIGAFYLYQTREKLARWAIGVSVVLAVVAHFELMFKVGRFEELKSPFRDIYGWDKAMKIASAKLLEVNSSEKALAVGNWSFASRAMVYSDAPVFLIDDRADQFDMWQKDSPIGKNLLFIKPKTSDMDINKSYICKNVASMGEYDAILNGGVVEGFSFLLCEDFRGKR